ncbi:hypothetical protein TIFTF001_036415 [Ficus carica]|uniref:Uncharacterized protein n=1 Tax=Ficus carica TaxID=3494 RepID=A0AA88JAP9_FICCA|nr:hypothetical protein TIFTF001_036415 [Ficus carica]
MIMMAFKEGLKVRYSSKYLSVSMSLRISDEADQSSGCVRAVISGLREIRSPESRHRRGLLVRESTEISRGSPRIAKAVAIFGPRCSAIWFDRDSGHLRKSCLQPVLEITA